MKRKQLTAILAGGASLLLSLTQPGIAQQNWRVPDVHLVEQGGWSGARLSDGQPDVGGHWSNTIGNHNNLTDPQGRFPLDPPVNQEPPRHERAPSRLSIPADGEFPFQPWARALQKEFMNNLYSPTRPEYVEPLARCAPGGPTKSLLWHGYEIRQFPGYVLFLFDSGTRLVHLDDKPLLDDGIKLWNGDSRGRWEGNTLHVSVANHNAKSRFGRTGEFVSEHAVINERYIFSEDGEYFLYEADYVDDTVLTEPMRFTIPSRRVTERTPQDGWNNITFPVNYPDGIQRGIEAYERTCAENNGEHGAIAISQ